MDHALRDIPKAIGQVRRNLRITKARAQGINSNTALKEKIVNGFIN
jgi:hypothetical protein